MRKITLLFLLTSFLGFSQNTVTVPVSSTNSGDYLSFMNVFDNPADGTPDCIAQGGFCFGQSGWTIVDLVAIIGASDVTLSPNVNTYSDAIVLTDGDRNYWTNSTDGGVTAGPDGNKLMEANLFVEPGATFNGQDLTFTGQVASNNLDPRYTASYFIKALDPNNNFADVFNGTKTVQLPSSGTFTISATGAELAPGLIIQYGFSVVGLNANPADNWGSVVVAPVSLSNDGFSLDSFKVSPNPSNDVWNIEGSNSVIDNVEVYDLLGKRVLNLNPNSQEVRIDASALKTGIYLARLSAQGATKTIKLVKN